MKQSNPRILIWDVETSPLEGWAWQPRDTDLIEVKDKSYLLSIAWQWYGEKKVHQLSCSYKKDCRLAKKLHSLINKADMMIYQNGDSFDLKVAQTRMLDHNLPPVKKFKPRFRIDTLKEFRKNFKFHSNKLDDVCEYLGIPGKLKHPGFSMWKGCMRNEKASQKLMGRYNMRDIEITRRIFERVRPWIDNSVLRELEEK